ncbi:MAG: beta-ketoacyl reductase [Leadbetterella sp.]|nr:beta-ketoacyl reductase [Leadbetterella sp.]
MLFNQLASLGLLPDKIIHVWNVTAEKERTGPFTYQSTINELDLGYYSLLNIARSIGSVCPFRQVALDVITSMVSRVNSGDILNPSRTTILGPVLTIPKEYSNILCRHVDINTSDQLDILLNKLFKELQSAYVLPSIAYRQVDRWTPYYEHLKLESGSHHPQKLKQCGVYLVTGGLGGIGVAISKYLANEFRAKLILTGRKSKLQVDVSELNKIGKDIIYLEADVAAADEMEIKITEAEAIFGKIDGIFHTAGIADYAGIIQNRAKEQSEAVFASKIYGTIVVNELAKSRNVDVLVLCSSMASVAAPFGQVGYTAANIFQNSFARYLGNNVVQSIGWDTWKEGGMAVASLSSMSKQDQERQLAFGLSDTEGIEVLKRVLAHDIPCVMVHTRNIEMLTQKAEPGLNSDQEELKILQSRPALTATYEGPVTDTEKSISLLFSDYFNIKEIGIDDDFFELGMDSLKVMTLISRIHQKLNIQLRINDILEHATIRDLSKSIDLMAGINQMQRKRAIMKFENKIEL